MKQNLKRNIALTFRVTEEEQALIRQAMERAKISNLRAYLLKMALNGRIITLELNSIYECNRLLRNIGNNINQIAKRANETRRVYDADITEIKEYQKEIWERQNHIIKTLSKIVEVA